MQGKIVVIEGLDGSGKTTQWEMLKTAFKAVRFITFPDYSSDSGRIIKRYLNGEFGMENAFSASSFYAVDRYANYKSGWEADYRNGVNIVSARYTSSNAIYQMSKLPEDQWAGYLDWLYDYEHQRLGIPRADLTIFLDVPIEISQKLLTERYSDGSGEKDIHEASLAYLQSSYECALELCSQYAWQKIACTSGESVLSVGEIHTRLYEKLKGFL